MRLNSSVEKIVFLLVLLMFSHFSFAETKSISMYSQHPRTVVIYIIGLAGTGKYTIAKQISKRGFKVVDNHLINNPIFSLLGKNGAKNASTTATEKVGRIRNIVLEFMVEDHYANYVLTNQLLENDYHHSVYNKIRMTAENRGSVFIPVVLTIAPNERARRIIQPERAGRYKITDVREAYKPQKIINVSHENLIRLNVTDLNANAAADKIAQHVRNIINNQ